MTHLQKRELVALALFSTPGSYSAKLKKHLASCPDCRKALKKLTAASLMPRLSAKPGRKLLSRIEASYDRITTRPTIIDMIYRYKKIIPAAAAAVIVIITASLVFGLSNKTESMIARLISGSATANSKMLIQGKSVKEGFRLITGKESRLALEGKTLRLKAGSETSLVIKKAIIDKKTGKSVFDLVIDRGLISANFDHNKILKSVMRTPHAKIISHEGSHIVISVGPDKTQLLVKQGNASLTPKSGDPVLTIEEGYSYTITTVKDQNNANPSIEQKEISYSDDDDDLDLGNSLFNE